MYLREIQKNTVAIVRRDTRKKTTVQIDDVHEHVDHLLETMQNDLLERAKTYRQAKTRQASSYGAFKEILKEEGGFILAHWNGSREVEEKIKHETKATIRCIPTDNISPQGCCIVTGEPSSQQVVFGIAY